MIVVNLKKYPKLNDDQQKESNGLKKEYTLEKSFDNCSTINFLHIFGSK
jgi:hypothetical protein